jgi:glycosyltransferase involved in cell wall biosynthesis
VLNKSLTVVLPIYNGEARLRECVAEILELASELTTRFGVLIIDDGSTDATFEVAEELSAQYPQVSVLRHRHRRGLGTTIEYAQRRVRSDAVIVHDGVTPIDPSQVRNLWRNCLRDSIGENATATPAALQSDVCDFANLPAIHAAMEQVHNRVLGFQWLTPQPSEAVELLSDDADATAPRTDAPHFKRRSGMGRIPPLPRPKFISSLAEFALGE